MKRTENIHSVLDDQLKQMDQDIIWKQEHKAKLHYQILSNLDEKQPAKPFFKGFRFAASLVLSAIIIVAGYLFLSENILLENDGMSPGTSIEESPVVTDEEKVNAEKSQETIQAVIKEEFNGPDETYKALFESAMEAQNDVATQEEFDALQETPVWKNYTNYMKETYAANFTELGYEQFLTATPAFMYSGFEGDYEMTASNIKISQHEHNEKMFQFTFVVDYKNGDEEAIQYLFEGEALASEDGKIEQLQFLDKDGLLTTLNENNLD